MNRARRKRLGREGEGKGDELHYREGRRREKTLRFG